MENYLRIVEQIKEAEARLEDLEAKHKEKSTKELWEEIGDLKLTLPLLRSNAEISFLHEFAPKVAAILKKYEGQSYDKARDKIFEEFKEETGYSLFINETAVVLCGIDYRCVLYTVNYFHCILNENKEICAINAEYFRTCYPHDYYEEHIPQRVAALKKYFEKVKEQESALQDALNDFNILAGDVFEQLSFYYPSVRGISEFHR